jgi:hypothetical protein
VQPCTFFRRALLDGPVANDLHYMMDSELYMRYLLRHGQNRIAKVSAILSNFRLHPQSKTVSQREAFAAERWALRLSVGKMVGAEPDFEACLRRLLPVAPLNRTWRVGVAFSSRRYLARFYREVVALLYAKDRLDDARACLKAATRHLGAYQAGIWPSAFRLLPAFQSVRSVRNHIWPR